MGIKISFFLFLVAILSCNNQLHRQNDLDLIKKYCTISNDTLYTDKESIWKLFPDSVFDNKLVIGCGQSSHGSHENFEIQASIFKNLVEKKETRIFIIEGIYSEILAVNDYISKGIGNKMSILPKMGLKIWVTEEMWELIEWMKEFNYTRPENDKIVLLGNSVNNPDATVNAVADFFSKFCPQNRLEAKKLLQSFEKESVLNNLHNSFEISTQLHKKINELYKLIENTDKSISSVNKLDYQLSKRNIAMLEQCLWTIDNPSDRFNNIGDSIMAANVKWVVESKFRPGPVFVWAHNGHITNQTGLSTNGKLMGTLLRDFFGDKYYAIGIDFISGNFNSQTQLVKGDSLIYSMKELAINKPDSSYLNYYISTFDSGIVFFNMEAAKKDSLVLKSKLFQTAYRIHSFPVALGDKPQNIHMNEFNAILFFKYSTPTKRFFGITE